MPEPEAVRALRLDIEELEHELEILYKRLSWFLSEDEPPEGEEPTEVPAGSRIGDNSVYG